MSEAGLEQYLDEIKCLDLSISREAMGSLSWAFGRDLLVPASRKEIQRSQTWLKSGAKHSFEKALALVAAYAGGTPFVNRAKEKIEAIDGHDGYYKWKMGFFCLPNDLIYNSFKL